MSEEQQLAYALYSASFFEDSADARFMMSLETLLTPQRRAPALTASVDDLIDTVKRSGVEESEIASIIGSLTWLHEVGKGEVTRATGPRGDSLPNLRRNINETIQAA